MGIKGSQKEDLNVERGRENVLNGLPCRKLDRVLRGRQKPWVSEAQPTGRSRRAVKFLSGAPVKTIKKVFYCNEAGKTPFWVFFMSSEKKLRKIRKKQIIPVF